MAILLLVLVLQLGHLALEQLHLWSMVRSRHGTRRGIRAASCADWGLTDAPCVP
jgi:hypothetical protein